MRLVDSHCHLDLIEQKDNLDEVIARATASGVSYLQTICTSIEGFPHLLEFVQKFNNVFASVGVHPNNIEEVVSSDKLIELASHPKVIGFGETGLDYYYQTADKEKQVQSFRQHITASQKAGLPVIVHARDADCDIENILTSEMINHQFRGLIHCFTASQSLARKMLDIGIYISISGIITFKNVAALEEVVRFIPIERLLIETDAPYLAPVPMRGKANEPSFVKYVAARIAEIKSISEAEVARQTTENFFRLFSKAAI